MKKNDIYDIEITGMTDDGRGVGRAMGMAVFVPYVITGETVRVHIIKALKNYAVGKLIEVIKPSPERVKAECPIYYKCGGCALMHMSYEQELKFKREKVRDCLERIGGFDGIKVDVVVPSPKPVNYRNKSQFPVTTEGIGMFAQHSHRLIETDNCLIASENTRRIIKAVKYWMKRCGAAPYDERTGSGNVRHIYTREGKGGVLVTVVTAKSSLPHSDKLVSDLLDSGVDICGIIQNINSKNTNVVLGTESKLLYGNSFLTDNIGAVKFRISHESFYQVNSLQIKQLYNIAKDYADLKGHEVLLDMYCGIGTIGQFMADGTKKVIGVEYIQRAVDDARKNAELNGIKNAVYYCGKAEHIIDDIISSGEKPDIAVLDPPRKGCGASLLKSLADIYTLKRIIYISCKPSTLARDLKILSEYGFKPKIVTPVDMFPRTPHVETVVLMSRIS